MSVARRLAAADVFRAGDRGGDGVHHSFGTPAEARALAAPQGYEPFTHQRVDRLDRPVVLLFLIQSGRSFHCSWYKVGSLSIIQMGYITASARPLKHVLWLLRKVIITVAFGLRKLLHNFTSKDLKSINLLQGNLLHRADLYQ